MASKIDAVLISHSDILHVGALPYAMKKLGLSAPVYSTDPVCSLGQLTLYDYYAARRVSFILSSALGRSAFGKCRNSLLPVQCMGIRERWLGFMGLGTREEEKREGGVTC